MLYLYFFICLFVLLITLLRDILRFIKCSENLKPEISCAVIARPTDSLVLYSQMVGRAIRGTESGGNAEAEIVTVIDENLKGFGEVADAFMNWEDVWDEIN